MCCGKHIIRDGKEKKKNSYQKLMVDLYTIQAKHASHLILNYRSLNNTTKFLFSHPCENILRTNGQLKDFFSLKIQIEGLIFS